MLQTTKVARDLDIVYREAGPKDAPAVLFLHGFPTSAQMFRNLIAALADRYRVRAPDYPGFGHNSMPPRDEFAYTLTTSPGSSRSSPQCMGDGTMFAFPFPTKSRDGDHAGEPTGQGSKMS
jgi:pimeloyl-ACP methyl ester carboxylesterase